MNSVWQLQEAKNRFSEVVNLAMTKGAQTITRHGKPVAVVLSHEEYQERKAPKKKPSLLEALQSCPYPEFVGLIERVPEKARDLDL